MGDVSAGILLYRRAVGLEVPLLDALALKVLAAHDG